MLTKRLAILCAAAVLPALAQVSTAPALSETTERLAPRQHRPILDRVDHFDGTATSTNWSGYAVTGTAFTTAVASWIVPGASCTSGHQYAAFWVGLDGYSSNTVEQTGTDSDCDGKNPSYYAWYEFYPNPSYEITGMTITPGDRMEAEVVYSNSEFTVTIKDLTTGKAFKKSSAVSGASRSSAEWIAEAPCCTTLGGILPLADFGTVLFGKDSTAVPKTNVAVDSTTAGVIGAYGTAVEAITMASKNAVEAVPSALSSDGSSFSVTWASQ